MAFLSRFKLDEDIRRYNDEIAGKRSLLESSMAFEEDFNKVKAKIAAAKELEKEGISAEVVDPRTLLPLDIDTIATSVRKTHRVLTVSEDCKTGGAGAEIAMQIIERCFDDLDAPPVRLAGADVPMPKAPNLEAMAIPSTEDIVREAKAVLGK